MLKNYLFVMVLFLAGWYPAWKAARPPLQHMMGERFVANFAITVAAGFFAPNIWLYHLVLVATFLLTTVDRDDAICRYVAMIALVPAVSTVLAVGSFYAGSFQPVTPLTIAMVIANVIKPVRGPARAPLGWRAEDSAVLALFLVFTVGAARFTPFTALLRQMFVSTLDILVPYWLLRRNLRSPELLRLAVGCIAVSAISLAVIALYERKANWPLFDAIQSRLSMVYGLSGFTQQRGNGLRAMASFGSPLILAYFLLLGLIAWLCSRDLFRRSIVWPGGIVVLALGILAPQSRGVLLAVVPAIFVLLVCRRRFAAAAAMLGASALGAVALFALQHMSSAVAGFLEGSGRQGQYYDYRGLLLHRGMQEGMKHPILGQSFDQVAASLSDITQGEHIVDFVNTYLTIFLISGLVGFAAFVVPALISMRKLIARARKSEMVDAVRSNRAFLLSALVGTYVYIYGVSFIDRVALYPVLLLAMSRATSSHLVRRQAPPAALADAAMAAARADEQRFPERMLPA